MMGVKRRTESERQAFMEGFAAGARVGAEALALVADATSKAIDRIQTDVAMLLVLGDQEPKQ